MRNNNGLSFVTLMIVIAVFGLLLRIGIEKIIKVNIVQNESNAQSALKLISTALDNYAKDHLGAFPSKLSLLTQTNPPYLDQEPVAKGYNYSCQRLDASGYSCSAAPIKCNITGKIVYTVSTGGLLVSEECNKKE